MTQLQADDRTLPTGGQAVEGSVTTAQLRHGYVHVLSEHISAGQSLDSAFRQFCHGFLEIHGTAGGRPVDDDPINADLAAAIDERFAARREAARRRRESRERFAAEKKTRRTAGLEARHARKIQRTTDKES